MSLLSVRARSPWGVGQPLPIMLSTVSLLASPFCVHGSANNLGSASHSHSKGPTSMLDSPTLLPFLSSSSSDGTLTRAESECGTDLSWHSFLLGVGIRRYVSHNPGICATTGINDITLYDVAFSAQMLRLDPTHDHGLPHVHVVWLLDQANWWCSCCGCPFSCLNSWAMGSATFRPCCFFTVYFMLANVDVSDGRRDSLHQRFRRHRVANLRRLCPQLASA